MPFWIEIQVIGHSDAEIERGWWIIGGLEQQIDRRAEPGENAASFYLPSATVDEARKAVSTALADTDPAWEQFLRIASTRLRGSGAGTP